MEGIHIVVPLQIGGQMPGDTIFVRTEVELAVSGLFRIDEQHSLSVIIVDGQGLHGDIAPGIDQQITPILHGSAILILRFEILIIIADLTEVIPGLVIILGIIFRLTAIEVQGESLCVHGPVIEVPLGLGALHINDHLMAGDDAVGSPNLINQQVHAVHKRQLAAVFDLAVGLLCVQLRQIGDKCMDFVGDIRGIDPAEGCIPVKARLGIVGCVVDPDHRQIIRDIIGGIIRGTLRGSKGKLGIIPEAIVRIEDTAVLPALGQRCQAEADLLAFTVTIPDVLQQPVERLFVAGIRIVVPAQRLLEVSDGDIQGGGIHKEAAQDQLFGLSCVGVGVLEGQDIAAVLVTVPAPERRC